MSTLSKITIDSVEYNVLHASAGENQPAALRANVAGRAPLDQNYLSLLTASKKGGKERTASVLFKVPVLDKEGKRIDTVHFMATCRLPQNIASAEVEKAYDTFSKIFDTALVANTMKTGITPR